MHIYYIYAEPYEQPTAFNANELYRAEPRLHDDQGHRGTIQVPRGSLKLTQDGTGLFLGVLAPSKNLIGYSMCDS